MDSNKLQILCFLLSFIFKEFGISNDTSVRADY